MLRPIAGGLITGRYKRDQPEFEEGSRFDPNHLSGAVARGRYWNDAYFDVLKTIDTATTKYALTSAEIGLRWLKYHSRLNQDLDDAIIIRSSRVSHLESNLHEMERDRSLMKL